MGWKLKSVEVNLKPNEEQDLNLTLVPEKRAAIHGVVRFPDGTPVKNALVKLFKKENCNDPCDVTPITFAFTDECGQFLFGVPSCVDFLIKVFYYKPERKVCEKKDDCVPSGKKVRPHDDCDDSEY